MQRVIAKSFASRGGECAEGEWERMGEPNAPVESASRVIRYLKRSVEQTLFGLSAAVDELLIALMARGHILLEDVPGIGKTSLAKAFATTLGLEFRRIQCTPDLLPADVVGGLVFHPGEARFFLRKGPVFTNLLLVDEINRALPRTQSALLEAMAEGQVTIDGETHHLPEPFLVIATQNPLESQGVFVLPEAQLDRFLLKTSLGYPEQEDDLRLLAVHLNLVQAVQTPVNGGSREEVEPLAEDAGCRGEVAAPGAAKADELPENWLTLLDSAVASVRVAPDILRYISNIVRATRSRPDVEIGASPRAMVMLASAARAAAVLCGRDFVIPDDVQRVAAHVLFHRLVLLEAAGDSGVDPDTWMRNLLAEIEVPIERARA